MGLFLQEPAKGDCFEWRNPLQSLIPQFFFQLLFVFLHQFENNRSQKQQSDQVGNGHERIVGVGDRPHGIKLGESANRSDNGEDDAERFERPVSQQIDPAPFTIDAPAKDGGKGEKGQRDRDRAERH